MLHKKIAIFIFAFWLITTSDNHSFNIAYDGNDALISYETSWGKERFVKEDYLKYFPFYEKYVEQTPFLSSSLVELKLLPAPYNQLKEILPFNGGGMYFNSKYIQKLFEHNRIETVIEIGSLYGLSTRHIATLLPAQGKLYAIDPWDYHPLMYEQFLSNIVLTGLWSKVVPIKKYSQHATAQVNSYASSFDLIYIDGDHETTGVFSDLTLYFPLLKKNTGIICGDDWLLKTVRTAVMLFAQTHNLTIYAACNFWFLKNEGSFSCKSFLEADDIIWQFTA